jgi:flagellar biogenesis protein FliO
MIPIHFFLAQVGDETLIGSERWTGGGGFGLVLVTLLLFLGLGLGALYLNRRGAGFGRNQYQHLKVLETRPLGGRQFLMVIAYGEENFLLSVCPGRVEYLCALPSLPVAEDGQSPPPALKAVSFGEIFDRMRASSRGKGKVCDS